MFCWNKKYIKWIWFFCYTHTIRKFPYIGARFVSVFFNQFKLFFCKYFPLFSKSFIPFFSLWIIKTEGKKIYETKTLFTMHKQVFSFDSFIELWLCKYDIDHFSGFHLKYLSRPTRKVVNTIFIAISFIPFCFYHISIGHMLKNGHTKFWNLLLRLPPWSFYSY